MVLKRKPVNRISSILLLSAFLPTLANSCGTKEPQPEPDKTATAVITAGDVTVEEGKTVSIGASTNSSETISYASADASIASVTPTGDVTGVKAGSTTISLKVAAVKDKFTAAEKTIKVVVTAKEFETVSYKPTDENFANPERGFYQAGEVFTADGKGMSATSMKAARLQGRSLYLLQFFLRDFVTTDISEEYLQTIRARFESLRSGGMKCILRFSYSNGDSVNDKPWDATPEIVHRHIEQVKPLIQEYYDVIMVVQAGFIGSWGEWYYTDNFKDAKGNLILSSCKDLVEALLDAVPADRQIELRTPGYKMSMYGYSLADTLTRAEAHQHTPKARLAGHNDCYLSSANDVGTFNNSNDRKYWAAETMYTIMGGESCALTNYCKCVGTDKYNGALKDLAIQHFTYLNLGYHQKVIARWREEGCLEEIKRRLGYRLVLDEGTFTYKAEAGKSFKIEFSLHNEGFSPVQNPRDAELVLADASGKVVGTWPIESDPRYWMPGQKTTVSQTVTLPSDISGSMSLYLNLPDPCETLHDNPMFSIRLANEDTWNEETGYNLLHTFTL